MTTLTVENKDNKEIVSTDQEPTRSRPVFLPKCDIQEAETDIVVFADMPGVDESTIDITLEQNVLTLQGFVEPVKREGYSLSYSEYTTGDYHRVFRLSNVIDRDGIKATVKNGVLKLILPKSVQAKTRKISVSAE